MKACGVAARFLLGIVGLLFGGLVCLGQDTGTSAGGAMANPGVQIPILVKADGDYRWKLDTIDEGRITAAMGAKRVMAPQGPHEVRAFDADNKVIFYRVVTVGPGKQITVTITASGKVAVSRVPTTKTTPVPTPTTTMPTTSTKIPSHSGGQPAPTFPPGATTNPDLFARIVPSAMQHVSAGYVGGRKTATASGWQIQVIASTVSTYYDIKLQMVMKGVGSQGQTVLVPDFQPSAMVPNVYTALTNDLGKEAVVCFTARQPNQPAAMRLTSAYTIRTNPQGGILGQTAFVASHEPTLEPASDAPCGGIADATIASPVTETTVAGTNAPEVDPGGAARALAVGSRLYNAGNYTDAMSPLQTACAGGQSADACNSVGYMYQNHLGVPADYAKARAYYLKSCNDDSAFSCNNLGTMYRDGQGVPANAVQAVKLFERACDSGISQGCAAAGTMYRDQAAIPHDYKRSVELYKEACDADLGAGCGDEGYMYAKGMGVAKDSAFAASLFDKGCSLGSRNSCFSMGMMYRGGEGVRQDPEKAREYFAKSCRMGDRESCGYAE
jgi:hypothetical protein